MKKIFFIKFILIVTITNLYSFDFNGVWSNGAITINNWHYISKEYSWGKIKEPVDCGFTIDLNNKTIFINSTWYFDIILDYDENNMTFSFINPLSKETENYSIEIISEYEIILKTDVKENPLIYIGNNSYNKQYIHFFKIIGPKNAEIIKAPVYARTKNDCHYYAYDWKLNLLDLGIIPKDTIVEIVDITQNDVDLGSEYDFQFGILVNSETGGFLAVENIEFLDEAITIGGYNSHK